MKIKTRAEMAAMTDDEILAYQREKHGNPYMPLSRAKECQSFDYRWLHDDFAWEERKREERKEAERQLRAKVFGA